MLRRPVVLGSYAIPVDRRPPHERPAPASGNPDISPYVAGESTVPGVNRMLKLSSNEGAFGVPPGAQAAIAKRRRELYRYPDGGAAGLRRAIGTRFGLDPARIVCGAGSDDLIYQLCLAYGGPGRDIIMSAHGFSIYQIAGTYAGSRVIKVPERNLTADLDAMLAAVSPATRLVFLANPNNPTGSMLPHEEVARLRAGLPPEVLLVLDAAYAEYVERPDYDPGIRLVDAADNTVMTADVLQDLRSGRHADRLVLRAAGGGRRAQPGARRRSTCRSPRRPPRSRRWPNPAGWRRAARTTPNIAPKLAAGLQAAGIKVWPSEGNFVLVDFATVERAKAADAFLRRRGASSCAGRRLRAAALPAHHRRNRRGSADGHRRADGIHAAARG